MEKDIIIQHPEEGGSEYVKLVSHISELWNKCSRKDMSDAIRKIRILTE